MNANEKWLSLPEDVRTLLTQSVYCSNCFVTTIIDYEIEDGPLSICLHGKCKTCGGPVARVVEMEGKQ